MDVAGVVLAAGAGTRLRPLTDERPKALCPVGDRALLDWALKRLRSHVAGIAVNVHHQRDQLLAHLAEHDSDVHVSDEQPVALGTAGALGALRGWLDGRAVLLLNADAWTRAPLDELVEAWPGEQPRLLCVRGGRPDFGELHYVGAALLPWSAVRDLAAEPSGLYEVAWRQAHAEGRLDLLVDDVHAYVDCGTPADYLRANLLASGGATVVGSGAVVEGLADRCVLWPGARVAAGEHLVGAIRTGSGLTVYATPEGE